MRLRYQRTFVRFLPFEADQNGEILWFYYNPQEYWNPVPKKH